MGTLFIEMTEEQPSKFGKFSRRGMLRGDWFKVIRDRGARQTLDQQKVEDVDFRIKKPDGNVPRDARDPDDPPTN